MNTELKLRIIQLFGTQGDFAKYAQIDESVLSRVIRGRRKLDYETKKKWSRLLGCDMKSIFEDTGD